MTLETDYTYEERIILSKIHGNNSKYRYTKGYITNLSNMRRLGKQMIYLMGYTKNTLYIKELYNILDRLTPHIRRIQGEGYTRETAVFGIVSEILDYYNARYDEDMILNQYNINPNAYMNIKLKINIWCERNYWTPKIMIA